MKPDAAGDGDDPGNLSERKWRIDGCLYTHRHDDGRKLLHNAIVLDGFETGTPPATFESDDWPADSRTYRHRLARRVLGTRSHDRDELVDVRLRVQGEAKAIGKKLIPDDLARWLWRRHDDAMARRFSAPLLLIQSREHHVPWELLWLRDPDGEREERFLAEAFALGHWLTPQDFAGDLPLRSLGLLVARDVPGIRAPEERKAVLALAGEERRVTLVPARTEPVLRALRGGLFDGWHLVGHGQADTVDAEASEFFLAGRGRLTPALLDTEVGTLRPARPFVFGNFCDSGRREDGVTGVDSLGEAFLRLGAGAFLGTLWPVDGSAAAAFAELFYREFLAGWPLAEAVRRARLGLRDRFPGDPAWLSYTLFGPPMALCREDTGARDRPVPQGPHGTEARRHLTSPRRRPPILPAPEWRPGRSAPSTLLRPEYGVVPFHGRERELAELTHWALSGPAAALCFCTGEPGTGKTRLALELCTRMRGQGWAAGLLGPSSTAPMERTVAMLRRRSGDLLLVVEDPSVARALLEQPATMEIWTDRRLRLLITTDARESSSGVVPPPGIAVLDHALGPLAPTAAEKRISYLVAGNAFAERLGTAPPLGTPPDLSSPRYDRVYLLHLRALVNGEKDGSPEELDLVESLLEREHAHWRHLVDRSGLDASLARLIPPAVIALSEAGGARDALHAMRLLEDRLDRPELSTSSARRSLVHLLHEMYGGVRWIDALRPRILLDRLRARG